MATIVPVRLASTVILARPAAEGGIEIYMARRSARSAFAPDAFVFPGGATDAQDRSDDMLARTAGAGPGRAPEFRAYVPSELPTGEPAIDAGDADALMVAALRELFEEAGVLFARDANGTPVNAALAGDASLLQARTAVHDGTLAFADFLRERDWYADAGALVFYSHWITPPGEPRRFNTHFFLAAAPPEQAADADRHETHDGIWIAPREALSRYEAHAFHLVYPTIKHLERLQSFDDVEALLAHARSKPIVTIMPGYPPDEGFEMPANLEGAW